MYDLYLNELEQQIKFLKVDKKKEKLNNHILLKDLLEPMSEKHISKWGNEEIKMFHCILHREFSIKKIKKEILYKIHNNLIIEMNKRDLNHMNFDNLDEKNQV